MFLKFDIPKKKKKKKKGKLSRAGDVVILWTVDCVSSCFYYKMSVQQKKNTQNNHFYQGRGENHKFCSNIPF